MRDQPVTDRELDDANPHRCQLRAISGDADDLVN